jgi:hypothetical protein
MTKGAVQPLQELLDSVVARLKPLKVQLVSKHLLVAQRGALSWCPSTPTNVEDHSPAVEAYDEYINKSVNPLVAAW